MKKRSPVEGEPNKVREKPLSKKLGLTKRRFSVTLTQADGSTLSFHDKDAEGQHVDRLFTQEISGERTLYAASGETLKISWDHPDQPANPPTSKPFADRNARNDIGAIRDHFIIKCYEKHAAKNKLEGQCISTDGLLVDEGGYQRVNIDNTWFRYTHVVLRHTRKLTLYQEAARMNIPPYLCDCSHLCNNKWCVNEQHLEFEPHRVNVSRRQCFEAGQCTGHDTYKDCIL